MPDSLLPGEPFETDYLQDGGDIHLFEPPDAEYPNAPLKSSGCVKLIEPSISF